MTRLVARILEKRTWLKNAEQKRMVEKEKMMLMKNMEVTKGRLFSRSFRKHSCL
jgi:hypothetical protein